MNETEIAIVGAGPVGLAAALAAASAGYRVTLIGPPATGDRRTSALFGGSVSLLRRLNVWDAIALSGAPLRTMRIIDGTTRLLRAPEVAFDAGELGLPAFGYNIPNAALVAAMETRAVERGVIRVTESVGAAEIHHDRISLNLAGGNRVHARLAVAADGRRSRLRDAAGIDVETWQYDQAALVCDLRHTQPHGDASTEFQTDNGPFTLVPLGEGRSSLVWVDRPAESQRRLAMPSDALAAEIEERSASILGAIAIDGDRQVFPLSGLTARRFAAGRIMLAGEAAHVLPPIGAQGLNLGLRDVVALEDVLSGRPRDPGDEACLEAYDRARRPDIITRTAAVDALNRSLLTPFPAAHAMRGLGLFLAGRIPAFRREAMRWGLGA